MTETRTVRAVSGQGGTRPTAPFGRAMLAFANLDMTYIFSDHLNPDDLERSLAQVLTVYPILAGRIVPNSEYSEVALNNEGVVMEVVRRAGDIKDIPPLMKQRSVYCIMPDVDAQVAGKAPVLHVRLTHLDRGCVLGVTISHLMVDAWAFAQFMQDWAACHQGRSVPEAPDHPPPRIFEDVQSQEEADAIAQSLDLEKFGGGPWVTKMMFKHGLPMMMKQMAKAPAGDRITLELREDQVKRLKDRAEAAAGTWVSTNEALMAHVWLALLDAYDLPQEDRKDLYANVVANVRGKIEGYPMRGVGTQIATMSAKVDMTGGFEAVAGRVHQGMREICQEQPLQRFLTLQNYSARTYKMYQHKVVQMTSVQPGILLHWNYQGSNDFYNVDFGTGHPASGIPWSWAEEVKVVKGPQGGLVVFVGKHDGGVARWIPAPKLGCMTYSGVAGLLVLVTLATVIGMSAAKKTSWELWVGAALALLVAIGVGKVGKRIRQKKVNAFFERIEGLLSRGL